MAKRSAKRLISMDGGWSTREMLLLLLSLVFVLLIVPLVDAYFGTELYRLIGLSLLVAALAWRVRHRGREILLTGAMAAIILPLIWISFLIGSHLLFVITSLAEAVLFIVAAVQILERVYRVHLQTFQAVWGAICAYLLLGLSWAMLYWVFISLDESAFRFDLAPIETDGYWVPPVLFSRVVYYSFVTMSTLGYGDFTPVSPLAQSASWMQAVVGQFYIAVFVARLVAMLPRPEPREMHGKR